MTVNRLIGPLYSNSKSEIENVEKFFFENKNDYSEERPKNLWLAAHNYLGIRTCLFCDWPADSWTGIYVGWTNPKERYGVYIEIPFHHGEKCKTKLFELANIVAKKYPIREEVQGDISLDDVLKKINFPKRDCK
jgi:hypothetical protein